MGLKIFTAGSEVYTYYEATDFAIDHHNNLTLVNESGDGICKFNQSLWEIIEYAEDDDS